jgi:hypothetical protein
LYCVVPTGTPTSNVRPSDNSGVSRAQIGFNANHHGAVPGDAHDGRAGTVMTADETEMKI